LALIASLSVLAIAGLRWLRVAQNEHYLPGSVNTVASRWWTSGLRNTALFVLAVAALLLGPLGAWFSLGAAAVGPIGLPLRGRTSRVRFTRRANLLLGKWIGVQVAVLVALTPGAGLPLVMAGAIAALASPLTFDLALWLVAPVENWIARRWAARALIRLDAIAPVVVGITGSYGKTSTKALVAYLVSGSRTVLASPASWNNRAGLARAVNEQLTAGTEVFVAEMGTYGPGEIAEMCSWFPPQVAVITAIGPVHLERFGSLDRTLSSKAEILNGAADVVLNVDDERLLALADSIPPASEGGPRLWRCSAVDSEADVLVRTDESGVVSVVHRGAVLGSVPGGAAVSTNLACAVASALAVGVPTDHVVRRLAEPLPGADHRLTESTGGGGFKILDDTFNSNPAGAVRALEALDRLGGDRRVVVTPGMVELGPIQDQANVAFAAAAAEIATDIVVVGRTNRRTLLRGAKRVGVNTVTVATRELAVEWVKANLGPNDAVLYENDLPDTYP